MHAREDACTSMFDAHQYHHQTLFGAFFLVVRVGVDTRLTTFITISYEKHHESSNLRPRDSKSVKARV